MCPASLRMRTRVFKQSNSYIFQENTDFGRAVREALGLDEGGGTEGRKTTEGEEEEEDEGGDDNNANNNSGNTKTTATATTTRDAALRDVDLRTMPGRDFTYQAGRSRALEIRWRNRP